MGHILKATETTRSNVARTPPTETERESDVTSSPWMRRYLKLVDVTDEYGTM